MACANDPNKRAKTKIVAFIYPLSPKLGDDPEIRPDFQRMWNMTGEHDRGNASMLAGQDCYRDEDGARFAGPIGEKSPFHSEPFDGHGPAPLR